MDCSVLRVPPIYTPAAHHGPGVPIAQGFTLQNRRGGLVYRILHEHASASEPENRHVHVCRPFSATLRCVSEAGSHGGLCCRRQQRPMPSSFRRHGRRRVDRHRRHPQNRHAGRDRQAPAACWPSTPAPCPRLDQASDLRRISLGKIDAALREWRERGERVPVGAKCLAACSRSSTCWFIPNSTTSFSSDRARVGRSTPRVSGRCATGRPVMLLDDLVVALRAVGASSAERVELLDRPTARKASAAGRLSCGTTGPVSSPAQAQQVALRVATAAWAAADLGDRRARFSHFARVLVAADYRMKRISMDFEPSPVRGLPSFLQMIRGGGARQNMLPRFWLEPALRAARARRRWAGLGTARRLGPGDGRDRLPRRQRRQRPTGKTDPVSQRWADHDDRLRGTVAGRSGLRPVAQLHGPGGRLGLDRQGEPACSGPEPTCRCS